MGKSKAFSGAVLATLGIMTLGVGGAKAQSLTEIADFAQKICGDIPEGSYTKTAMRER